MLWNPENYSYHFYNNHYKQPSTKQMTIVTGYPLVAVYDSLVA